jgi:hypothetical protein
MAIRALEPEVLDQPAEPHTNHAFADAPPPPVPEGDIEVLGTLVVDRVAEIVELRQALAEQAAIIAQLRAEVEAWRTQAITEATHRRIDAETARRHERELVSEIHRRMIEIDVLTAELAWRRLPWWRRVGRQSVPTEVSSTSSVPH